MKQLDELKTEVKKDFKSILESTVEKYIKQIEERVKQVLFSAHNLNPDLSINANLSGISSVDITDIFVRIEVERGEVKSEVLKRLGAHGYDVERVEENRMTLVTPTVPAITNSVGKVISPTIRKNMTTVSYFLLLTFTT